VKILVINCGSSSVKFGLFELGGTATELIGGQLEKIGEAESRLAYHYRDASGDTSKASQAVTAPDHRLAFAAIFAAFRSIPSIAGGIPDAIGHRVVHGGEFFNEPVRIDGPVLERIRDLNPLAPLHNPVNVLGMEICAEAFPSTPQVAVFDTAFHQTLPAYAYRYAVPESWYRQAGIRRYGFHGTSHQYLTHKAADYLGQPVGALKLITLHLGNGASAAAIRHGKSIDTSMGFTPLEGLVMGSRSGDLDPMAALQAVELFGLEATRHALMNQSGLKGLCGSNDLREIIAKEAEGDEIAKLALDVYCHRIRKYLGGYFAILGGIDALIFSGGVGENSAPIRERVCEGLQCLGLLIDKTLNDSKRQGDILEIQIQGKNPKILVIQTNEELEIANQTAATIQA